jgi:hypothetical protein
MLSAIMLSAIVLIQHCSVDCVSLSIIIQSVGRLSVVMLSVTAPQ